MEHEIIAVLEHARQSPERTNLYLIRMDDTVMTTSQRLCRRPTKAEALGIPRQRTGTPPVCAAPICSQECDFLLVVGAPAVRPEHVARLARVYHGRKRLSTRRASVARTVSGATLTHGCPASERC